jgi:hypothetical protein
VTGFYQNINTPKVLEAVPEAERLRLDGLKRKQPPGSTAQTADADTKNP